jgi:transposase
MMGRLDGGAEKLFYAFSLEEAVPSDHLLRKIARFLDFDGLRAHLRPYYSDIGRPSVDPELMIRMLIVGYCFGIRSERRLCEEVHLNLAYRWFCRLGIEDRVPDHSTFSVNRHGRFRESDLFRKLFESTVVRCMAEGLVRGEGFATDASLIRADASRKRSADGDEDIDWSDPALASRPVAEYLAAVERQNTPPKKLSLTDPGARWTSAMGGPAYFAWSANYLADVGAAVIVDVEPTEAIRNAEVNGTKLMIDRTEAPRTARPRCWLGSLRSRRSSRMSLFGRKASGVTGPSAAPTSSSMRPRTATAVRAVRPSSSIGATSNDSAAASPRPRRGSIVPANSIAGPAP